MMPLIDKEVFILFSTIVHLRFREPSLYIDINNYIRRNAEQVKPLVFLSRNHSFSTEVVSHDHHNEKFNLGVS